MGNRTRGLLVAIASLAALGACGGQDDATTTSEQTGQETTASGAGAQGNSALDTAASAIVSVQSDTYDDYEVDGTTVRLMVRDGVTLSGSECAIIGAATAADHPDATFVVVESDGTETSCATDGAAPDASGAAGNEDAEAYAKVVMSTNMSDVLAGYEVDGSTVRFTVKDGADLDDAQCLYLRTSNSALRDAAGISVLVVDDGTEVTC